ncbi:MAG: hypothetical protein R3292_13115 [Alcanivorax sp.]|nr:hypothetical protein [Alcanivorax sp.]
MRLWHHSHSHDDIRRYDEAHQERELPAGRRREREPDRWLLLAVLAMIVALVVFAVFVGNEGRQVRDAVHHINSMASETLDGPL